MPPWRELADDVKRAFWVALVGGLAVLIAVVLLAAS